MSCRLYKRKSLSVTGRGEEVEKMTDEEKDLQLYINPIDCINCGRMVYQNVLLDAKYTWMRKKPSQEGELESVKKITNFKSRI